MTRGSIGRWATLAAVLYNIQVAAAADLPAAAPVYKASPPVAAYDWTGFYVGGNIGYGWGRANATDTVVAVALSRGSSRSAFLMPIP